MRNIQEQELLGKVRKAFSCADSSEPQDQFLETFLYSVKNKVREHNRLGKKVD